MTRDSSHTTLSSQQVADYFEVGNYALVALQGGMEQWQTYAALGLIGKTQAAIAGLSQFDCQEATFYRGVAHWMAGDEEEAFSILQEIDTPHAQDLLWFIIQPQISVLAQIPWHRVGSQDWLTAASQDTRFQIRNISFHPHDLPNYPYADIQQFYDPDEPPHFYICQMVEWHLIPPNLQQLPCPIFGQTADYDVHLQAVYPWLQLFDELLVTDQSEWQDVRCLVDVPVSTFPKSFCLPASFPPFPQQERSFDIFLSGTVSHPYHPDKAKLLHQVLSIPDLQLKLVNGFDSPDDYYANLAASRVGFSYVRHPSALPTRALDALGMGCAIAVQEGCVLQLFVGEEEGVVTYDYEAGNLDQALQKILNQWSSFEASAQKGAEIVREEFAATKVASQYLRFLTFLAAKPRHHRTEIPADTLVQKRSVLHRGWVPSHDFCHSPLLIAIANANVQVLRKQLAQETAPSTVYIDLAREVVLAEYHRSLAELTSNDEWLMFVLGTYKTGIEKFPNSLVLRFNLIRVACYFGQPEVVSDALTLLAETLDQPLSSWKIDPLEDVFPWDFCPTWFNYRRYFDLLTEQKTQNQSVSHLLGQLILASLYYHWGHYSEDITHFERAYSFDPDFPYYKFSYAKQLLQSASSESTNTAIQLLIELLESALFIESFQLLEKLPVQHQPSNQIFEQIHQEIDQFQNQFQSVGNFPEPSLKPDLFKFKQPQVLASYLNHNLVAYVGMIYGLPQAIEPINLLAKTEEELTNFIRGKHERRVKGLILQKAFETSHLPITLSSDEINTYSLEELDYYYHCLSNGLPYFGKVLGALQGLPIRHAHMQQLVKLWCDRNPRQPLEVLEIGSWAGGSAITWADALKKFNQEQGTVTCIDAWIPYFENSDVSTDLSKEAQALYQKMTDALVDDKIYRLFCHNISTSGHDDIVKTLRGVSCEVLPNLESEVFNLVFIDGDHRYSFVLADIQQSLRLVANGGIICGDDLELQLHQIDVENAQQNRELDYILDPATGQFFHPGVTLAVGEVFGEVSTWDGFWAMQKKGDHWQKVALSSLNKAVMANIPTHLTNQNYYAT